MKSLLGLNSNLQSTAGKSRGKTWIYTFTLNSCWQFLFSYHVAPCQASANPELILLSRSVAVKGTLTANLHGSHKAATDKKLSMRIRVEIIYISLFYFLLPMLCFPWNACQCGLTGSALSSQGTVPPRHPALSVPSRVLPHSAKLSPRSFLSQKLWITPAAQAKFPLIHRDPQNFQQSNRTKIFHICTLRAFHICNTMAPPYQRPGSQRMLLYLSLQLACLQYF